MVFWLLEFADFKLEYPAGSKTQKTGVKIVQSVIYWFSNFLSI